MREFPALTHLGVPLSWRHFVYGLAHLNRARARDSIRTASATGISGAAKKEDVQAWFDEQRAAAGWR